MGGREGEREGRLMYVHVSMHVWVGEGVGGRERGWVKGREEEERQMLRAVDQCALTKPAELSACVDED